MVSSINDQTKLINTKLDTVISKLDTINTSINNFAQLLLQSLTNYQQAVGEYFNIDFSIDWQKGTFTHKVTEPFKEALIDVYHTIDNFVNPMSDDNVEQFNAVLTDYEEHTIFGSFNKLANEVIPTIANQLNQSDGNPTLSFKLGEASSSYYKVPTGTITVDLSWYSKYKSYGDMILSGFMWISYLWLLFKRAPDILNGAGMLTDLANNMDENQTIVNESYNVDMNGEVTSSYRTTRTKNATGGYDTVRAQTYSKGSDSK